MTDHEEEMHKAEHDYVKLVMKREARRELFYDAVIDKTIASLLVGGILSFLGWCALHFKWT